MVICHGPHGSSNCDIHIIRQLGYKQTFHRNAVSKKKKKKACPYIFIKKTLHAYALVYQTPVKFFLSCKIVNQWVMTNCCFIRHILLIALLSNTLSMFFTELKTQNKIIFLYILIFLNLERRQERKYTKLNCSMHR